jgi:hypothetical protein
MSEYMLLRSQRNTVLALIKQYEVDPFNFSWSEVESKYTSERSLSVEVSRLSYKDTEFYFQFDFLRGEHYAIFSPGEQTLVEEQYPEKWSFQLNYVKNWLMYLKREIEKPDLWAELAKYQLPPGEQLSTEMGNEPFTAQQFDQIAEGLRKVRAYLEAEFDFNEQQQRLIGEKLDYLLAAAKRQGRKDWLHTSIGVIFTLATALAFSPEQAKTIWNILKVALSGIIQLLP